MNEEVEEDVGWESGVQYEVEWSAGYYKFDSSGNAVNTGAWNDHVTSFLPCKGASDIIANNNTYDSYAYFYRKDQTFIRRVQNHRQIVNPSCNPVPRDAYYCRMFFRANTPSTVKVTPYLYPTLREDTEYELNQRYVLKWNSGTDSTLNTTSLLGYCHGAANLQTSLWGRSFIYFYDESKAKISESIRQNNATLVTIPENAYYVALNPLGSGNSNNPWIMFTE